MAQKIKRESWLVFYRTKSGKLMNKEYPVEEYTKGQAITAVGKEKGFDKLEVTDNDIPIVKRLQYV